MLVLMTHKNNWSGNVYPHPLLVMPLWRFIVHLETSSTVQCFDEINNGHWRHVGNGNSCSKFDGKGQYGGAAS